MPPELSGYRTLGQLGVGARSTINQVVRITSGQFFALKRLVRRGPDDERFFEQAETEYRIASSVDHPALRKCYEIRRHRKWFKVQELLILMEYVPGRPLEQARPGGIVQAIDIIRRVAMGLDALHEHGYVHADIKPSNILITDKGDVKIIDFGQSCPLGHKKDRIQGTPDYIAPEQVRKLPLDRRTDVFNLGATLYWVLTGRTYPTDIRQSPKPGGHEIEAPVLAPKDLDPSIPAALSQLAMDCCMQTPDKRPVDMKQVVARLGVAEGIWRKQGAVARKDSADAEPVAD